LKMISPSTGVVPTVGSAVLRACAGLADIPSIHENDSAINTTAQSARK